MKKKRKKKIPDDDLLINRLQGQLDHPLSLVNITDTWDPVFNILDTLSIG